MEHTSEKVKIINAGVRYRARKHFLAGDYTNPYFEHDPRLLTDSLLCGMAEIYNDEIQTLLHERICPSCGQFTIGDIDY